MEQIVFFENTMVCLDSMGHRFVYDLLSQSFVGKDWSIIVIGIAVTVTYDRGIDGFQHFGRIISKGKMEKQDIFFGILQIIDANIFVSSAVNIFGYYGFQ